MLTVLKKFEGGGELMTFQNSFYSFINNQLFTRTFVIGRITHVYREQSICR